MRAAVTPLLGKGGELLDTGMRILFRLKVVVQITGEPN
jgi:hypothetical protein